MSELASAERIRSLINKYNAISGLEEINPAVLQLLGKRVLKELQVLLPFWVLNVDLDSDITPTHLTPDPVNIELQTPTSWHKEQVMQYVGRLLQTSHLP